MKPAVTVVNIATGDPELLNGKTVSALRKGDKLVLRTARSPLVSWLQNEKIDFVSLDDIYDNAEDFNLLADSISSYLWSLAAQYEIVYAVPDMLTDISVARLYAAKPDDGEIILIPGIGLSGVFQTSACPHLSCSDLRTVSATDFLIADYDPNVSLLITELDNPILAGEVKIRLSECLDDEYSAVYLHDHDKPDLIPMYELDRQNGIDHLSAVLVPGSDYLSRQNFVLEDLMRIMDRLRAPDGCPWDRDQTHHSLRPYMIEEAWECVAAIDGNDTDHLADELGDLLFQIVFHSSIGKSFDEFSIKDVIDSICLKMIRRHPHVFKENSSVTAAPSAAEWEKMKRSETGSKTVLDSLDDVSPAFPSLKYASKMLRKLSLLPAFRRDYKSVLSDIKKMEESLHIQEHVPDEAQLGHILFLYTELCFLLKLDPEMLLHKTVTDLKSSLQKTGKRIADDGKTIESLTLEELGVYLNHVEGEIE